MSYGNLIGKNKRYRIEKNNYVVGITEEYKGKNKTCTITAFGRNGNSQTFTDKNFTPESDNHNNDESISQNKANNGNGIYILRITNNDKAKSSLEGIRVFG